MAERGRGGKGEEEEMRKSHSTFRWREGKKGSEKGGKNRFCERGGKKKNVGKERSRLEESQVRALEIGKWRNRWKIKFRQRVRE